MAKYLMLSQHTNQNWTLPANTDLEKLRTRIEDAMTQKKVIRVPVQIADRGVQEILLNGAVLDYAAPVEMADTFDR